jgi:hypothetical protein
MLTRRPSPARARKETVFSPELMPCRVANFLLTFDVASEG